MSKLDELKKHIAQASELLLGSADPFDRACTIVNELKAELDKLEQEQQTKLWPQVWDEYWYVDEHGDVRSDEWDDHAFDHYRLTTGNCHRTEAEALAYREWQTDPRVVARGMIERMDGFDPRGRYFIEMLHNGELRTDGWLGVDAAGTLNFKTIGVAQNVIDNHPDLCKVALSVITDKEEAGRIVRLAMGNVSDSGEAMGRG